MLIEARNMAALLTDNGTTDLPALVAILGIIIGLSTISSALITGLLINPKLEAAKKEILTAMVSKEVFEIYTETDTREHTEIKSQIAALPRNHR